MLRSGRFRSLFAFAMFFVLMAPDAVRSTVSWWGYGVIVGVLAALSVALLVIERDRWAVRGLPIPLVAFLLLTGASIAWSHYPAMSLLGAATTWATIVGAIALAVVIPWDDLLRYLGYAVRAILGISLVFELAVAIFVQRPVLPLWYPSDIPVTEIPSLDYWTKSLLFEGGQIQGIVGNSNLLAFVALIGIIVFGVQLADNRVRLLAGWTSMSAAILTLLLTRSATIAAAIAAIAILVLAVWLIRRASTPVAVGEAYLLSAAAGVGGVGLIVLLHAPILDALDKTSMLTGRIHIWEEVIGLAEQRPFFGWGWISHWAPWVDPLGTLVEIGGVYQLQAHNAWLDIWLQLGILGLVVFGALVLVTIVRTWWMATDRRKVRIGSDEPFIALTVFPLLVLAVLLVQSLSESRILVEGGLLLFALLAVKTKRHELG